MSNQEAPKETQPKAEAATLVTKSVVADMPEPEIKIVDIDNSAIPDDATYESLEIFDHALEHYGEEGIDDFLTPADVERVTVEEAKWIQKAIKNPGGLHRALGVPQNEPIPMSKVRSAAKSKGKVGRMARLALTLKKLKKESTQPEVVPSKVEVTPQAIVNPVVDSSLGERVITAIKDGFAALKSKPEEVKPVIEAKQPEVPKPVETPKVEAPKVEEAKVTVPKVEVKVEKIKEEKPMPDKVEEAGKGVVETEAPEIAKPMTVSEAVAKIVQEQVKNNSDGKRSGAYKANLEKGKVAEANEYTFSNAGSAIPEIWANEVLLTMEKFAVLDKIVVHYDDLKGKPGDVLNIPTLGTMTFGAGSEASEATGQAPATSAVPITISERIAEIKFDKALVEDCIPALITQINTAVAQAYEWDFDSRVLAWLNTPAAAAPIAGTLAEAGSLAGTCIAKLLESFRAGTQEPKWLIIHPVQEASLLQDDQFVNAATYGDNSIIQNGRVWHYLGVDIVVSPQVTATGGTYVSYMISDRALAVANKRDFEIETYYHPPTRVQYYVATARYGGTIAIPGQVWKLTTVNG